MGSVGISRSNNTKEKHVKEIIYNKQKYKMINFDDYTNENKIAIYSRSSIQNTYYRWFRIGKNKCIIKFNK